MNRRGLRAGNIAFDLRWYQSFCSLQNLLQPFSRFINRRSRIPNGRFLNRIGIFIIVGFPEFQPPSVNVLGDFY
jgi:hypothetical protein